jgi:hypothetical protein
MNKKLRITAAVLVKNELDALRLLTQKMSIDFVIGLEKKRVKFTY